MLLFSFSVLSDRWSLKKANENNSTKTLARETRVPRVQVYIETNPGWQELPLTGTNFYGPSLFKLLKFYCMLFYYSNSFIK